jgi:NADP+-dependent farnesol dehydrogenase
MHKHRLLVSGRRLILFKLISLAVDMEKWRGKVAVVTGASAGIGAEIVRDLARNGIKVVALARRVEVIEEIKEQLGSVPGEIIAIKCDVSSLESIKETFKAIEQKFGAVNILVNNAGVGINAAILEKEPTEQLDEKFDQIINTNFAGLVYVTRYAYPLMLKSDDYGMIVNINSIAGHIVPFPKSEEQNANVYHGTKHAVTSVTEILVTFFDMLN